MDVLSSGHLSLTRKTSWNVRETLSTIAATPNTECWAVHWLGDSLQWNFLRNIQTRTYTFAWRRYWPKRRRLVAAEIAWHPYGPWHGCVRPDPLYRIIPWPWPQMFIVSGQFHENVENSRAIFSVNSRRADTRLRALVCVRDLRRIVQLQRRVLTPSNRGLGWRKGGCKTVRHFRQNPWYVACLLHVFKIYRWFV